MKLPRNIGLGWISGGKDETNNPEKTKRNFALKIMGHPMTRKPDIKERLKELLYYDPVTGVFTWLVSNSNRVKVGDVAGTLNIHGYIRIKIDSRLYSAHRLAFLYMEGKFPNEEVDHINHIRDDNRWENLRQAARTTNQRNRPIRNDNTSGTTGVGWKKSLGKWLAHIHINGKQAHLGYFNEKADAIAVRKAANKKYDFHPNHGT